MARISRGAVLRDGRRFYMHTEELVGQTEVGDEIPGWGPKEGKYGEVLMEEGSSIPHFLSTTTIE